jgi:hypothetical protein
MARSGLHKSEVKQAKELLLSQGKYPSFDAVRAALGNTGSKSTIHRFLKELEKEEDRKDHRQARTAKSLQDLVEELAARLHAEADARIEEIRAGYEAAMQQNALEMAALRKQVDTLQQQLRDTEETVQRLELTHDLRLVASAPESAKRPALNLFSTLLSSSRDGGQARSFFNLLFNTRSGVNTDNDARQAGYEMLSRI